MKYLPSILLCLTVVRAEIKVSADGYTTTKPDTAIIHFVVQEKSGSVAKAKDAIDSRIKELNTKSLTISKSYGTRTTREIAELADRYSAQVSCEREYVVTREIILSGPNDPNVLRALLGFVFEGPCHSTPPTLEPTLTFGLRDSSMALLVAYDHALEAAKATANEIATRSGLRLGRLISVEKLPARSESAGFAAYYWGEGARSPFFGTNLEDQVVVDGSWSFTFFTE